MLKTSALLALVVLAGCVGEFGGEFGGGTDDDGSTRRSSSVAGAALQQRVLERAAGIAPQNRPYVFNGVQDCYGYVRQVWNAILVDGSAHAEDYAPNPYNRSRWLGASSGLPVNDAPSANWIAFSGPDQLLPGDVLATAQGHAWGDNWHGGIYAGVVDGQHVQWDNTVGGGLSGAYRRPLWSGFRYYYRPTHDLLAAQAVGGSQLAALHSGKCLDLLDYGTADGDRVGQWSCHGGANQRWELIDAGDGSYALRSAWSGKCLDVLGYGTEDAAPIGQWSCHFGDNQRWDLLDAGDGTSTLRSRWSGKCLDVSGVSVDDAAAVWQWTCYGGDNQRWTLSATSQPAPPAPPADAPAGPNATPGCPPPGASGSNPPALGDLAGQACDYACWGSGTLYNACGSDRWQFCLPSGVFASCAWM